MMVTEYKENLVCRRKVKLSRDISSDSVLILSKCKKLLQIYGKANLGEYKMTPKQELYITSLINGKSYESLKYWFKGEGKTTALILYLLSLDKSQDMFVGVDSVPDFTKLLETIGELDSTVASISIEDDSVENTLCKKVTISKCIPSCHVNVYIHSLANSVNSEDVGTSTGIVESEKCKYLIE